MFDNTCTVTVQVSYDRLAYAAGHAIGLEKVEDHLARRLAAGARTGLAMLVRVDDIVVQHPAHLDETTMCESCATTRGPFTVRGCCPHCAGLAVLRGDGDHVGLPRPDVVDDAVNALADHLHDLATDLATKITTGDAGSGASPGGDLVAALLSDRCPECAATAGDTGIDLAHVVVDNPLDGHRIVAVDCRGEATAATRAAALIGGAEQ